MNAALLCLSSVQLPAALADPDESVTAGREALDQYWSGYPWYDSATDGVRRVDIPDPWDWSWLPDWNWLWGSGGYRWSWFDTLLRCAAWLAIVLLLAAVAYLLYRFYRSRQGQFGFWSFDGDDEEDDGSDADRIEALPFAIDSGRLDLLGEARRHYQQGNYRQAIIYLFSYQLVQLDRQQIIRLTKGKTNRQYMREVGRRTSLRRLVEQTMVAFEDVFFGNHALERPRFESCWSRLDEFQSLLGEGAQA